MSGAIKQVKALQGQRCGSTPTTAPMVKKKQPKKRAKGLNIIMPAVLECPLCGGKTKPMLSGDEVVYQCQEKDEGEVFDSKGKQLS